VPCCRARAARSSNSGLGRSLPREAGPLQADRPPGVPLIVPYAAADASAGCSCSRTPPGCLLWRHRSRASPRLIRGVHQRNHAGRCGLSSFWAAWVNTPGPSSRSSSPPEGQIPRRWRHPFWLPAEHRAPPGPIELVARQPTGRGSAPNQRRSRLGNGRPSFCRWPRPIPTAAASPRRRGAKLSARRRSGARPVGRGQLARRANPRHLPKDAMNAGQLQHRRSCKGSRPWAVVTEPWP